MAVTVKVVASIEIDKPIREVFEAFTDPEFNGKVDLDTVAVRRISGVPREKGAKWELDIRAPLFGIMHETQTITEIDPPYRYVVEVDQKPMSGPEVETFDVTPEGRTKVVWESDYDLAWYVVPLYFWLKSQMKTKSAVWIGRMKTALETGVIPPE